MQSQLKNKMIFSKYIIFIIIFSTFSLSSYIDEGDSIKKKNPAIAWKLSIIPGLGQIYNEAHCFKTFAIIFSEIHLLSQIGKYSHLIKTRNRFTWWFVAIYFMNIIDAYVDAELTTFPKKNQENE